MVVHEKTCVIPIFENCKEAYLLTKCTCLSDSPYKVNKRINNQHEVVLVLFSDSYNLNLFV